MGARWDAWQSWPSPCRWRRTWARASRSSTACARVGCRGGRAHDPSVIDALAAGGEGWLAGIGGDPCPAVLEAEPLPALTIGEDGLDGALGAVADFADLKSPWFGGHSTGGAELAAAAARRGHGVNARCPAAGPWRTLVSTHRDEEAVMSQPTDEVTTNRLEVRSADGTRLAVWAEGEGPPLVLVHGAPSDHATFDPLVQELRRDFTTFGMDRRGSGDSGDTLFLERNWLTSNQFCARNVDLGCAHGRPCASRNGSSSSSAGQAWRTALTLGEGPTRPSAP